MSKAVGDRSTPYRSPGIAEWRAASLADYRDALDILGMRQPTLSAVVQLVIRIRDRNESLLIRSGIIGGGSDRAPDRLR